MRLIRQTLVLAWLTAGCTATETGNPVAEVQLSLTAGSSTTEVGLGDAAGAQLQIEQAWVVLGDVRFVPSADCDAGGETRVEVPGPNAVDLIAAPTAFSFAVEDRDYCRVRVPLERAEEPPSGAPSELEDHSVVLLGSLRDGTPVLVRSRDKREADVRSRGMPFRLGDVEQDLLLVFDLGGWLEGVDLEGAELQEDGRLVVDDDSNRELLDAFEDNLRQSLELLRDLDRDGQVDDEERAERLASGA